MGQFTFHLPAPLPPDAARCLGRAALAGGYDQSPVPARAKLTGDRLALTRDVHESGYLLTPWPVPGFGTPAVLSATLRDRPEPYHLLTELTRGKLNQVRTQLAEWESAGLALSPAERAELAAVTKDFGKLVLDPAADPAGTDTLAAAHRLGDRLTATFTELLMRHRVGESGPAGTRLGARLYRLPDDAGKAAYTAAFNAARLVPSWAAIEPNESRYDWAAFDALVDWAVGAGLQVSVGPLVDLAHGPFPDWVRQWAGDLPSLAAFLCDFVETLIARYRDRVRLWQVFAGFNHADALDLTEDDRIRLAARLTEAAQQAAPDGHHVVGLSVAWGDYLTSDDLTYSPLVFADTLLRGGLQVGGIELELLCGDGPRASLPRTVLDTYRLLDLFALLGVPLEVGIAAPSGPTAPPSQCPPGWVAGATLLALSVSQIHGVTWDCWSADDPARVPGTALWGSGGAVGPYLGVLGDLRRKWVR